MGGQGSIGGVSVRWAVGSDVGLVRSVNEDSFLAAPPAFVVADGMGGHEAGDVASALLVDRFRAFSNDRAVTAGSVTTAIEDANATIFAAGGTGDDRSMGTTAVGLVLVENGPEHSWLLFNVGDSRAYRLFDSTLEQLSVDHSYVQELVDSGHIGTEEARSHPHRNVVTRALGVEGRVHSDVWVRLPVPGERFLLCSDGLSSEVDDEAIGRVLAAAVDPEAAAVDLVQLALAAGGRDNVTVLVLDVSGVNGVVDPWNETAQHDEVTSEHPIVAQPTRPMPATVESLPDEAVVEVPGFLRAEVDDAVQLGAVAPDMIDAMPAWPETDQEPIPGLVGASADGRSEEEVEVDVDEAHRSPAADGVAGGSVNEAPDIAEGRI